ncbi:Outer membrane protein TolC [Persephonella hydrogeniphila]|uniref:Outer membrane protein TolC n=1 Tax=Persephonella hydrogeniphila TaxID=198703 RepID=A0A285NEV3_9AQUI|nr:TolC family protein [Persephonella hydrogeniphila]SNZ08044.1 Outer membrane protein TolC [Persephonella hydrogeniphila]
MRFIIFSFLLLHIVAFSQSIEEIIENHPKIRAIQEKLKSYENRAIYEKSLPDPVLSISVKDIHFSYQPFDRGLEPMQAVEIGISQFFPLPKKREKREQIFLKKKDALYYKLISEKQQLMYSLYTTLYKIWEIQEKLKIIDEYKKLAKDLIKLTDTLYSVGKVSQSEVFDIQYFYSNLIEREIFLKGKKDELLATLLYFSKKKIDIKPELPADIESLDSLIKKASKNNPYLLSIKEKIKLEDYKIKLAKLDYKPDFRFFGSYSYRDGFRDYISVGVSFNIPLWKKNRQDKKVIEQLYLKQETEKIYTDAVQKIKSEIQESFYKAVSHKEVYHLLKDTMLVQTEAVYGSIISEYQVGKKNIFDVIKAINQILSVKMKIIEEITGYNIAVKDIERLTGEIR